MATLFVMRTWKSARNALDSFEAYGLPKPEGKCARCGKWEREDKFKVCGGCSAVRYCSKECQVSGWLDDGHNETCGKSKITEVVCAFLAGSVSPTVNATELRKFFDSQVFSSELTIPKCIMNFVADNVCPCLLAGADTRDMFRYTERALAMGSIVCQNCECKRPHAPVQAACFSLFTVQCKRSPWFRHIIPEWFCSSRCQRFALSRHTMRQ